MITIMFSKEGLLQMRQNATIGGGKRLKKNRIVSQLVCPPYSFMIYPNWVVTSLNFLRLLHVCRDLEIIYMNGGGL